VAGVATGTYLVLGPTYTECQSPTITSGGAAIGAETCRTASMWQIQRTSGFPAPYGFILLWSLAPFLAFIAAWLAPRPGSRIALGGLALVIEVSVLISFGAAPLFLPVVLPLVLITFVALLMARRPKEDQR
jgi:hypothetical protein